MTTVAPAPTAPAPASATGTPPASTPPAAGGEAPKSWLESLAPEFRDLPDVKDLPDVNAAVKRMVEARKLVGAKGIIQPGKDAKPEEWNAYWNALGRPEKPDGYEIPKENMPDGFQLPPEISKAAFDEFHKLGISKNQAAELIRWNAKAAAEHQAAAQAAQQQEITTNNAALRKEWGQAYDEKIRQAENALTTFGGEEAVQFFKENPALAANPTLVKMFAAMGREIAEDPIRGGGHQQSFALSPTEAQNAINAKNNDPEFQKAYNDAVHPGHAKAVEEMNALYRAARPEPAAT